MKKLRIASRAIPLAISLTLFYGARVWADTPIQTVGATSTSPASATPVAAQGPISPPSAQLPENQGVLGSTATSAATPTSIFDSIFTEKLPITLGIKIAGIHSDNIFYYTKKEEDYFTEISPSVALTFGTPIPLAPRLDVETLDDQTDAGDLNYVQISYEPTLRLFDKHAYLDDVDENADAIITHQFSRLTLSLEQSYVKASQPTVQINAPGTLVDRDGFNTTAKANYIYSDQLSTYGTLSQSWNHYIGTEYDDYTEWVADYYFLYQLFPKLSIGLGPRIGFDDIDRSPNESFQDGLVHFNFLATSKFNVGGAVGAELRQFQGDAAPERVTPIVEGAANYHPFDSMTITLDGERHHISSAGRTGGDYTASVGTLELRQRFFQVVYATLEAQYEEDDYLDVGDPENAQPREDHISLVQGGLEWKSFRGLTIDASYRYLHDASNVNFYTFNESRATLSASFKY